MSEQSKDNALSRIYREGSWPEPSRQIDQAILAASRRAAREHSFVRRWAPSFAIAATVVLTSTLVLKVYREQPEAVSPSVSDNQPETRAKQGPTAPEPKVAEAKTAAAPPAPATPRGFTSTMDSGEADRLNRLQRDLGLKQISPASESPLPAPKSAPAEKAAPTLKKEALEAARSDQLQRRSEPPAARARESLQFQQEQPTVSAPVSVFGAQAPAQAPSPQAAPAAPAVTTPVPASPASVTAIPDAGNLSARVQGPGIRGTMFSSERSPQTWLEDIRKLVAEGKLEQADRELADFKKRYPDYVLPENLR